MRFVTHIGHSLPDLSKFLLQVNPATVILALRAVMHPVYLGT